MPERRSIALRAAEPSAVIRRAASETEAVFLLRLRPSELNLAVSRHCDKKKGEIQQRILVNPPCRRCPFLRPDHFHEAIHQQSAKNRSADKVDNPKRSKGDRKNRERNKNY